MPGNPCEHCVGMCCRYIALPIDTPVERADFDDLRWYLLHEGVAIFVEDGDWYIHFTAPCRHLRPDFRCAIYRRRPRICRQYAADACDYHSGDYGWEQHFTCPEHLDAYVREFVAPRRARGRGRAAGRRTARPRRPARLHACRRAAEARLAAGKTDVRGTPLPVLGVVR